MEFKSTYRRYLKKSTELSGGISLNVRGWHIALLTTTNIRIPDNLIIDRVWAIRSILKRETALILG